DDGHALLVPRSGDFTASLTFSGVYDTLYDQAGLMVRSAPESWTKFGVELMDGQPHLSVVVTRELSDWSTEPLPGFDPVTIRVTRLGGALLCQHRGRVPQDRIDADGWRLVRLAPCPTGSLAVGPYLCSPQRQGFGARFEDFRVTDPVVRDLHG
ncbi:MAG: DUF1349 domain-containing protein, partial [Pseudomonadota bacterium]